MQLSFPLPHEPFVLILILLAYFEHVTASVLHHYNSTCQKTSVAILLVFSTTNQWDDTDVRQLVVLDLQASQRQ
jgi:hypothetical protein